MAIFIKDCAICGLPISQETPFVSTSGVFFPSDHPLWKFCDTGLHQRCLVGWKDRHEFSLAYCSLSGALELVSQASWSLHCGPVVYGPHGKAGLPYYAEIRLKNWPVRLKAKFQDWGEYVSDRKWEEVLIPEIRKDILQCIQEFPDTTQALEDLLLPHLVNSAIGGADHKSRYVSVLVIGVINRPSPVVVEALKSALSDAHGSVRQAAASLLKQWKLSGGG